MERENRYYTVYHTGGKTLIFTYSKYDAILQVTRMCPNFTVKRVVEGLH